MATVINRLENAEVAKKKAEVAEYCARRRKYTINGLVPTIVLSRVSSRKTFVGWHWHEEGFDGVVKFDSLPDGCVLAQFVNGEWR